MGFSRLETIIVIQSYKDTSMTKRDTFPRKESDAL